MDTAEETWADYLGAQREIIQGSLDAIGNDVSIAQRNARLFFPMYPTVLNSGDALVNFATPLDPSDDVW